MAGRTGTEIWLGRLWGLLSFFGGIELVALGLTLQAFLDEFYRTATVISGWLLAFLNFLHISVFVAFAAAILLFLAAGVRFRQRVSPVQVAVPGAIRPW